MHGNDKRAPANSYSLPKLSFRGAKPHTPGWPLLALRANSPSGNLLRHCTKSYGVSGDCRVGLRPPRNDSGNGDLVLLLVVRLRTPREGCPYCKTRRGDSTESAFPAFGSEWGNKRVGATLAVVPGPRHACRGGLPQGQPLREESVRTGHPGRGVPTQILWTIQNPPSCQAEWGILDYSAISACSGWAICS